MTALYRAVVRSYDAVTHTADVELIQGPAALLSSVPVLEPQDALSLTDGDTVIVLLWDDIGGIVIGAYT